MLRVGPPVGPRFSLPHTSSVPCHLPASVSPPNGWQSWDGVGEPVPRGRHGLSGCPRAGKVPRLRKRCSHRDPKNRKHQTCSSSSSRGLHPGSAHPQTPGLGEQRQPPPTRLRPNKLIARAAIGKRPRRRALKGCPVLAPWATAGDNAGTALGCQPTAPRVGPILHPRAQRCRGGCGVLVARGQLAGAGTVSSATLNY